MDEAMDEVVTEAEGEGADEVRDEAGEETRTREEPKPIKQIPMAETNKRIRRRKKIQTKSP